MNTFLFPLHFILCWLFFWFAFSQRMSCENAGKNKRNVKQIGSLPILSLDHKLPPRDEAANNKNNKNKRGCQLKIGGKKTSGSYPLLHKILTIINHCECLLAIP